MDTQEEWRPVHVAAYAGIYEVSSLGRVRNAQTKRVLKPYCTGSKRKSGQRHKVMLCDKGNNTQIEIGAAVLTAFLRSRVANEQVMHKDDDFKNNALHNLQWGTGKENMLDCALKQRWPYQKLGPAQVKEIFDRRSAGEQGKKLAAEFGVSMQLVCDIFKKRSAIAKHLKG